MGGESLFEPATRRPENQHDRSLAAPDEKSRWRPRRIVVVVGIGALLLLLSGAISVYVITERLGNNIERVPDTFESLDAVGPPAFHECAHLSSRGRGLADRCGRRRRFPQLPQRGPDARPGCSRPGEAPRWCRSPTAVGWTSRAAVRTVSPPRIRSAAQPC